MNLPDTPETNFYKREYIKILNNFELYTKEIYTLYMQNELTEFSISDYFFFTLNYLEDKLKINDIKDIYLKELCKNYSEKLAAKCVDNTKERDFYG